MSQALARAQGNQDTFNALVADTYSDVQGETPDGLHVFEGGYRAPILTGALLRSHQPGVRVESPFHVPSFSLTS